MKEWQKLAFATVDYLTCYLFWFDGTFSCDASAEQGWNSFIYSFFYLKPLKFHISCLNCPLVFS